MANGRGKAIYEHSDESCRSIAARAGNKAGAKFNVGEDVIHEQIYLGARGPLYALTFENSDTGRLQAADWTGKNNCSIESEIADNIGSLKIDLDGCINQEGAGNNMLVIFKKCHEKY